MCRANVLLTVVVAVLVTSGAAAAQETPGSAGPPPTAESASARRTIAPDAANVRLELTVTDTYSGTPIKKTVSMLVQTGRSGSIRANRLVLAGTSPASMKEVAAVLNVDATVGAISDDRIQLEVRLQYTPLGRPGPGQPLAEVPGTVSQVISVLLRDGKPLVVSQSAEPGTDRTVTIEVTGTIVR